MHIINESFGVLDTEMPEDYLVVHVEGSQQLHDDVMEILAEMEGEGWEPFQR